MRERLARAAYRLLTWLLLPAAFAYFWWRGRREPAYRRRWRERLGYAEHLPSNAIWIHAASVGEVALARPLAEALLGAAPKRPLVVTTFTPTGAERVQTQLGDAVTHCYLPLDTDAAIRRFLRRLQPRCGIIIETELWPNLLSNAARANVPMIVANANISARSAARYRRPWLAALMRPALAGLAAIAAAAPVYARRFEELGAPAERIHVIGNLKYDLAPAPELGADGKALRRRWQAEARPVWVAASTHEGEEAIVLAAHRQLRAQGHNALLILAPRHPQRFASVRELLQQGGWQFAARSEQQPVHADTAVVLGDTLGDVPLFYALADVAFVGGSLVPGIGGHNMLEAAALARPILVGPHTEEWQDVTATLADAGALRVADDATALAQHLQDWCADLAAAERAGEAAQACVTAERGALARLLALLEPFV
ncbi:MAG TPA: lipid IV(A) 3-deoxy-D-manno-octulosonic acid transferase [Salinisphaeraceae bacterium]|nr:lipid IV(A) 3-deoxy-D-manno-octulosonic acid transferase [Salinisphaeraceae bacterium]